MSKQTDKAKGEAKEKLGKATGDKSLEREGKVDKGTGKAKEKLDELSEKAKDAVNEDRKRS